MGACQVLSQVKGNILGMVTTLVQIYHISIQRRLIYSINRGDGLLNR